MTHTAKVNGEVCGGRVTRRPMLRIEDDGTADEIAKWCYRCVRCGPVPESEVEDETNV